MPIQPFGFDRVFHFSPAEEPARVPDKDDGFDRTGELEARLARLEEEHRSELTRVRSEAFEAGLDEARRERDAAVLASSDALNAALDDLRREFSGVSTQIAQDAATVAYEAARMLAGHATALDPGKPVAEALERALSQVARGTGLVLKVNPALREDLESRLRQRHPHELEDLSIALVDDPSLALGDARIDWTGGGLGVDAKARQKAVLAELEGLLGKGLEA
ncbi:hypothetical protein HT136_19365 [Novosphingobium profundi]|uniref:FliH/SctL family protein n=1 Tax=Novosphingobium profundi TaxID=1774954 RepID=UPI001BD9450A|nr:FliH/SctL family protein [Novosphingobium profundi]MBT0670530.1 hypothetical protein [Novosphingobium profundi]